MVVESNYELGYKDGYEAAQKLNRIALLRIDGAWVEVDGYPINPYELVSGLRRDAGDYGRQKSNQLDPGQMLAWDQANVRAWRAAEVIYMLTSHYSNQNDLER